MSALLFLTSWLATMVPKWLSELSPARPVRRWNRLLPGQSLLAVPRPKAKSSSMVPTTQGRSLRLFQNRERSDQIIFHFSFDIFHFPFEELTSDCGHLR